MQYELVLVIERPFGDSPKRWAGLSDRTWSQLHWIGMESDTPGGNGCPWLGYKWAGCLDEEAFNEVFELLETNDGESGGILGEFDGVQAWIPSLYFLLTDGDGHATISLVPDGQETSTYDFASWEEDRDRLVKRFEEVAYA